MKTKLILLLALLAVSAPAQLFNYPAPGVTAAQLTTLSNAVIANLNGVGSNATLHSSGGTNRALRVFLGTQTNSNPLEVSGTWNAAGTTFSAATISITDTASASASKFLDLQSNGVTRLSIRKNGQVLLPTTSAALPLLACESATGSGFYSSGSALAYADSGTLRWFSLADKFYLYGSAAVLAFGGSEDAGVARSAAGVLEINSSTAGTYRDLRLRTLQAYAQPSDPASSATFGQLYAKTNGATTEVYVMDGAGNVTQISPHARASSPAPASVDAGDKTPIVIHHKNLFTGEQEWLHLSAMARKLEQLTGEKFVWKSRLPASEVRDWDAEQARLEAESDAEVKTDRARLKEWERSELTDKGPRPQVREKHRRAPKPDFLK